MRRSVHCLRRGLAFVIAFAGLVLGLSIERGVSQEGGLSPEWQQRILELENEVRWLRSQPTATSVQPEYDRSIEPMYQAPGGGMPNYEPLPGMAAASPEPASDFPTIKVGGFFQADGVFVDQSPLNIATVGDAQNGADFRRARISTAGKVWSNVSYMMEFDFAFPGRPSFMDVYLELEETALGSIRIGQWRIPFGMDNLTSVKELTFLERALPFAFAPFRQIGVGTQRMRDDELGTFALSVFRYPTDIYGANVGDNGGFGMATRWTLLPYYLPEAEQFIHIGLSYSFVDPANDVVRYLNTPELFVSETGGAAFVPAGVPSFLPPFVDTDVIATTNVNLFGVEAAASSGAFHVQSEVVYTMVNQLGGPTETLSGAYAQAAYVLTGEHRAYNPKAGVMGRVQPRCNFGPEGIGAWEIAARWSYLDLNSGNIAGGRLQDLTGGLNWYLNPHTKFQFNYIHADLTNRTFGESNANFVAVRAQIDY